MSDLALVLFVTGLLVYSVAFLTHWVKSYVRRMNKEIEEEVRRALVNEWRAVTFHLDNWNSRAEAMIKDALRRQWDNSIGPKP